MKKIILSTIMASTMLCAFAQDKVGDIVKSGDNYFAFIAEFNSPEANEEFQRNVSIVQNQNSQIKQISDQIKAEKSEDQKRFLEATLGKLQQEYKQNASLMSQAYGFAENRTYKQIYLESNLCFILTKDEIAKLKMTDGTLLDPMKMANKSNFSMYRVKTVSGAQENEKLQNIFADMIGKQVELNKLRKQISETKDALEQKKLNDKLATLEKQIKDTDASIRKTYGVPEKRDYAVEISKSRLYMLLTKEEVAKIEAQIAKAKKNAPAKK